MSLLLLWETLRPKTTDHFVHVIPELSVCWRPRRVISVSRTCLYFIAFPFSLLHLYFTFYCHDDTVTTISRRSRLSSPSQRPFSKSVFTQDSLVIVRWMSHTSLFLSVRFKRYPMTLSTHQSHFSSSLLLSWEDNRSFRLYCNRGRQDRSVSFTFGSNIVFTLWKTFIRSHIKKVLSYSKSDIEVTSKLSRIHTRLIRRRCNENMKNRKEKEGGEEVHLLLSQQK